jgi:quercetin dioxygenase-like cupin family protein
MPEEKLSTYMSRLEAAEPQMRDKSIIISHDVEVEAPEAGGGIRKVPIAWPLHNHKMFYHVTADAGTEVARHSHPEDVFRMLISGSLTIRTDDEEHKIDKPGTWFVVRKDTPYSIHTDDGYEAFSGYWFICPIPPGP